MNAPVDAGFAGSELESYRRVADMVAVRVTTAGGAKLLVTFKDVIGLRDTAASDFSGFVQDTPALPGSPYTVYSFLGNDGEASLEIVATSCAVAVEGAG